MNHSILNVIHSEEEETNIFSQNPERLLYRMSFAIAGVLLGDSLSVFIGSELYM